MRHELNDRTLELVCRRFKVLSEPMRLRILDALRGGESTVKELVQRLDTSQANVSKHLGLLRRQGLVLRRKEGVHSHYRIADPGIFELCDHVCDTLASELEARSRALDRER